MRTWQLSAPEPWEIPAHGAIMGILNLTPDSFSDGGCHNTPQTAISHACKLVEAGAHIIDIGGESTRPGSAEVAVEEELRRTLPIITALRAALPHTLLSIDTRHAQVALAALQAGVHIVNDITGLTNPAMLRVCAAHPCGIVLMHMQGTPTTMQQNPQYTNVVAEVRSFFEQRLRIAEQAGINPERICLDPGIGFGKTTAHCMALLAHLEHLRVQQRPLLMGLSRKRFLGDLFGAESHPLTAPTPTVAMSLLAATHGADIHRVHDVAPLHHALHTARLAAPYPLQS